MNVVTDMLKEFPFRIDVAERGNRTSHGRVSDHGTRQKNESEIQCLLGFLTEKKRGRGTVKKVKEVEVKGWKRRSLNRQQAKVVFEVIVMK